jgi:hypothetical protein
MAPEQIEGLPCLHSDQYALGVVVYEWLAGYPPFRGSLDAIIYQHFNVMPPSLCASLPIVPQAAENVVFKALAKDPRDRFESVQAFAVALQDAFKPRPLVIRSGDDSQPPRPQHFSPTAGQRQIQKHTQEPERAAARARREQPERTKRQQRKTWKEIAAFSASDLLVSTALACVLAGLNVTPFLLELLMALCLVLLPLAGALIRRNNALFFLICSIAVTAALAALLFHELVLFVVVSIGLLLLSLLTALAVIFSDE